MGQNFQYRDELLLQLKESYGRVVYTYTTHLKKVNSLKINLKRIKYGQIGLSAISSGGFLSYIVMDKQAFNTLGGIFSVILLAFNLFFKNFNIEEEIKQHMVASDELWLVREKYISLMTDFKLLSNEEIANRRDLLQEEVYKIYKKSPKTDLKSYKKAQQALKSEEEQFFTNEELNKMLPAHLRV